MTDDTDERGEEYVARQRGGDHLDECYFNEGGPMLCICDRLRACEARVAAKWDSAWTRMENHFIEGYAAALTAALEAVVAVDVEDSCGFCAEQQAADIAAIDALRGESNG